MKKFLVVAYFKEVKEYKYFFFETIEEVEDFKESVKIGNRTSKLQIKIVSAYKLEEI